MNAKNTAAQPPTPEPTKKRASPSPTVETISIRLLRDLRERSCLTPALRTSRILGLGDPGTEWVDELARANGIEATWRGEAPKVSEEWATESGAWRRVRIISHYGDENYTCELLETCENSPVVVGDTGAFRFGPARDERSASFALTRRLSSAPPEAKQNEPLEKAADTCNRIDCNAFATHRFGDRQYCAPHCYEERASIADGSPRLCQNGRCRRPLDRTDVDTCSADCAAFVVKVAAAKVEADREEHRARRVRMYHLPDASKWDRNRSSSQHYIDKNPSDPFALDSRIAASKHDQAKAALSRPIPTARFGASHDWKGVSKPISHPPCWPEDSWEEP